MSVAVGYGAEGCLCEKSRRQKETPEADMTTRNVRYVLVACVAVGIAVVIGGRAATKPVTNEREPGSGRTDEVRIINVLEDMYKNQRHGMMNVTPEDGRLLRVLTATAGAKHVVEIGTSNGYSTIWFCLALQATGGKITTYELDAYRAGLARENFKRAGVSSLVRLVEGNAHKEILKLDEPIDILFLDADKAGYLDYLDKLLPRVRPGGLILAHNTTDQRPSMKDYLDAVTTNPALETIFLHEQDRGIGVSLKKRQLPDTKPAG